MRAPSVLLSVLVLCGVCGACGGSKPKPAMSADTSDSDAGSEPPPDPTPPKPPPSDTPTTISCVSGDAVCAETIVTDAEAQDAKDRCTGAKGESHDGECTHDNIAATCAVEAKKLTLYYYKTSSAGATKGLLKNGATSCKSLGGVFTPTKPTGGGGKKKKPKKGA